MKIILITMVGFLILAQVDAQERRMLKQGNDSTKMKTASTKLSEDKVKKYIGETEKDMRTTTKLPEGTTFKDGKIMISKGYHARYADNRKVVVLQRMSNGITVGTFACSCINYTKPGDCLPVFLGSYIGCTPTVACNNCQILLFPGNPPKGTLIAKSTLKWQKLILSPTTKQ